MMLDSIFQNKAEAWLEQLVQIDSYSLDPDGVNAIVNWIERFCKDKDIQYERISNPSYGDHCVVTLPGENEQPIICLGHMDTVFEKGTAAKRPYRVEGNRAYGPGVSDMKASLVQMLLLIEHFHHHTNLAHTLQFIFTPDEEVGSPLSGAFIQQAVKGAKCVLNMEPARPDGSVVIARKGSAHLEVTVTGKAAHSGLAIHEGVSAIDELVHLMSAMKALMNDEKGVTINIGKIEGGVANNTVAPHARCTVHIGYWKQADFLQVLHTIQQLTEQPLIPGAVSQVQQTSGILPMERSVKSNRLLRIVEEAAAELNLSLTATETMGAADAGFAASVGVATICGMGPIGGKWHAEEEYMERDSLFPRFQLSRLTIEKCMQ